MTEVACAALLLAGAFFTLVAAIGIVRMPDLFLRMSCTTKAATLGVCLTLLGAAVFFADVGVASRALAAMLFLLVTAPVAAQVIGRAAYLIGVPLWSGTVADQLRGRYDRARGTLTSPPEPPGK
jgi:multicomponent Na+:H+ antiporter subunit G